MIVKIITNKSNYNYYDQFVGEEHNVISVSHDFDSDRFELPIKAFLGGDTSFWDMCEIEIIKED